jgi:phosphoribosylformylglycinamidine cyclo-ligase
VTGGGIARRIPALAGGRKGLQARLFAGSWPIPKIFSRIQAAGSLSQGTMRGTFNLGVGLALACKQECVRPLVAYFARARLAAWNIGIIERQ